MAEFVQQSVEEMLPELEQMSRVGLFTDEETRTIVKKRTDYEYKIRRKTKQKSDFLQYIQYEINVLGLVKKRRQKTGYNFKKVEIDKAIKHRIHKLFRTICFRYQDDCKLWMSHIDFCKNMKDTTMVSRLFTRMLQVHNRRSELWILAAKWEMEDCLSMENSRKLLQRGLRFNPSTQVLWIEYFRMELLNAEKLRKRRDMLGLAEMETDEEELTAPILEGRVAEVVCNKAMEAFPDNIDVLLELINITKMFSFAGWLEDKMYQDLRVKFPESERMWDAVAQRCMEQTKKKAEELDVADARKEINKTIKKCIAIYESAVEKLNTERMWTFYLGASLEHLHCNTTTKTKEKMVVMSLALFTRAAEEDKLTTNSFLNWIELLENVNDTTQLESVLEMSVVRYPESVQLWKKKVAYMVTTKADIDALKRDLDRAAGAVQPTRLLHLWMLVLDYCTKEHSDKMESILQSGEYGVCGEVNKLVKERQVSWAGTNKSIAHVRKVYNRLKKTSPLSSKFFTTYIQLEKSQPTPKMKKIRDAYEDALRLFGSTNTDVWMDYIKTELKEPKGHPESAGQLHWRALKALEPPHLDHFTFRYSMIDEPQPVEDPNPTGL